jgi:hypothetical protein
MIIQSIRLAYRGSNKVVSLKISTEHVSKRTGLLTQGSELEVSEPIAHIISGENKYAINKFYCNWDSRWLQRKRPARITHVSSTQLALRVARNLIKERGNSRVNLRA